MPLLHYSTSKVSPLNSVRPENARWVQEPVEHFPAALRVACLHGGIAISVTRVNHQLLLQSSPRWRDDSIFSEGSPPLFAHLQTCVPGAEGDPQMASVLPWQ